MSERLTEDIEIEKRSMNTDDAIALFHDLGMEDKEKLFKYRRSSRVNIYVLDHYKDYFTLVPVYRPISATTIL